jgi:hypothetical protein
MPIFDGDGGTAMFPGVKLKPDTPVSRCIQVGYGSQATSGTVRLSATDVHGALADKMSVVVQQGVGDCGHFTGKPIFSGSLRALGERRQGISTGWIPSAGQHRTFRITVMIKSSSQPVPGTSAKANFAWQVPTEGTEPGPPNLATPIAPSVPPAARDDSAGLAPRIMRLLEGIRKHASLPLALVAVLIVFVLVQNRADRKDPKLALAPVRLKRHLSIPVEGGTRRA